MSVTEGEGFLPRGIGAGSLLRRRRLVGACAIAGLLAGLLVAVLKPATFTATTQLLVYTRELHPGADAVVAPGRADVALVQNQIEIIKSRSTLSRVVRALNLADNPEFASDDSSALRFVKDWIFDPRLARSDDGRVKEDRALHALERKIAVTRVGTSHTILVKVTTSDPVESARIANEIVRNAPQEGASEDTRASREGVLVRERLQGLGPSTYVMSKADPPLAPDGPRRILLVAGAAFLGFAVGGALAILLDFRDRTIRTAGDVESLGLECLGAIPRVRHERGPARQARRRNLAASCDDRHAWAIEPPHAMLSQTLRRVKAVILSSRLRSIGVASPAGANGATALAANLARLAALSGLKVLLVEGAPSSSPAAAPGGRSRTVGERERTRSESAVVVDPRTGLHVLAADETTDEAWVSRISAAASDTTSGYDLVVADLPPLARRIEFRAAAQKLDGLLLVVRWGNDELERVRRSLALSGEAHGKFVGAVLDMVDEQSIGQYGDKLWKAEADLAARRRAFDASRTAAQTSLAHAGVAYRS